MHLCILGCILVHIFIAQYRNLSMSIELFHQSLLPTSHADVFKRQPHVFLSLHSWSNDTSQEIVQMHHSVNVSDLHDATMKYS